MPYTNRGPRGLVIDLGKNLESCAAGFTHFYIAWEKFPSVVCKQITDWPGLPASPVI